MTTHRYHVTVYDGSAEPLWGLIGVDATGERDAKDKALVWLKDAVAHCNTTLDLTTVRLEVKP